MPIVPFTPNKISTVFYKQPHLLVLLITLLVSIGSNGQKNVTPDFLFQQIDPISRLCY